MTIFMNMGWFNPVTMGVAQGEKAVANYDEDSITMAASASLDCLKGRDRAQIDALYLASTSLPYRERQNAGIVAAALDLKPGVRTADLTDSTKSGTTAVLAGLDNVKANGGNVLVASADCRLGRMGSMQEQIFGDAGAALLLGSENVIAEFKGAYSISYDFVDHYRAEGRQFDRSWEDRWVRELGYGQIIGEAVMGFLKKTKLPLEGFNKVIYNCPFTREHQAIAKKGKIAPDRIQGNLFEVIGDSGAAQPLVMLVAALEAAKPGDKLLLVGYGNGADALAFEVTPEIEKVRDRKGVKGHLAKRADLTAYTKYCVFRNLLPVDVQIRGEIEPPTSFTTLWRNRRAVMAYVGSKCKQCGTRPSRPRSSARTRSAMRWARWMITASPTRRGRFSATPAICSPPAWTRPRSTGWWISRAAAAPRWTLPTAPSTM
jgi:3-hydroxy-3-methylglutaryl CoA synthase